MVGVDLVISALFETSGFRCEGDCAWLLPELITSKTKATKEKLIDFTAPILLRGGESESANHVRYSRSSFILFAVAAALLATPKLRRRVGGALRTHLRTELRRGRQRSGYSIGSLPPQTHSLSFNSSSNWRFRCRRADFLIARRSAATACFSAWRSRRVRVSIDFGKCVILGRCAPTLRSLGFAYGSTEKKLAFLVCDKKDWQCCKLKDD